LKNKIAKNIAFIVAIILINIRCVHPSSEEKINITFNLISLPEPAEIVKINFNFINRSEVITESTTSISSTTATANLTITDTGGEYCDEIGFDYGATDDYGTSIVLTGSFDTGSYSIDLNGLEPGTTYHIRAKAHNIIGWSYGNDIVFHTWSRPPAEDIIQITFNFIELVPKISSTGIGITFNLFNLAKSEDENIFLKYKNLKPLNKL